MPDSRRSDSAPYTTSNGSHPFPSPSSDSSLSPAPEIITSAKSRTTPRARKPISTLPAASNRRTNENVAPSFSTRSRRLIPSRDDSATSKSTSMPASKRSKADVEVLPERPSPLKSKPVLPNEPLLERTAGESHKSSRVKFWIPRQEGTVVRGQQSELRRAAIMLSSPSKGSIATSGTASADVTSSTRQDGRSASTQDNFLQILSIACEGQHSIASIGSKFYRLADHPNESLAIFGAHFGTDTDGLYLYASRAFDSYAESRRRGRTTLEAQESAAFEVLTEIEARLESLRSARIIPISHAPWTMAELPIVLDTHYLRTIMDILVNPDLPNATVAAQRQVLAIITTLVEDDSQVHKIIRSIDSHPTASSIISEPLDKLRLMNWVTAQLDAAIYLEAVVVCLCRPRNYHDQGNSIGEASTEGYSTPHPSYSDLDHHLAYPQPASQDGQELASPETPFPNLSSARHHIQSSRSRSPTWEQVMTPTLAAAPLKQDAKWEMVDTWDHSFAPTALAPSSAAPDDSEGTIDPQLLNIPTAPSGHARLSSLPPHAHLHPQTLADPISGEDSNMVLDPPKLVLPACSRRYRKH